MGQSPGCLGQTVPVKERSSEGRPIDLLLSPLKSANLVQWQLEEYNGDFLLSSNTVWAERAVTLH